MQQTQDLNINSTLTLNVEGVRMPRFGLGTARMTEPRVVIEAIQTALQTGYRLIDTSKNYENEEAVGRGIRESMVPENEIFLTTKLEKEEYGYTQSMGGFEGSLKRLGVKKIDLYLIHSPENDRQARVESWRGLTELVKTGKLRSAGVSNYNIDHMREIEEAGLLLPAVNQIELHPFNYRKQREIVTWCQRHAVRLMAYSPLGVGDHLDDPRIEEMAKRYRKTPAQVLIRWSLQHDFIVIPKSERADHIRANADVFDFDINPDDIEQLDNLGRQDLP